MKIHPHDLLLRRSEAAQSRENGALVAHLKACPRCRERASILRERQPGAAPEELARVVPWPQASGADYGRAFEVADKRLQVHARNLAAERTESPARLAELMKHPPQRRELLMRNHPRFQTWGLLERLIEHSRELCFTDPLSAEELARLAVCLSGSLDQAYYGHSRLEDLLGRAWGYVGNARRIRFQLDRAEEAFEEAARHLEQGTGDVLEKALLLELQASLRRSQRRFAETEALLFRSLRIYRKVGETHRVGRILVGMSNLHDDLGTLEQSIPMLRESLGLIDAQREPRLHLMAHHNLVVSLVETGKLMEAQHRFSQARSLYDRFSDGYMQNRRSWVVASIARAIHQDQEAEVHFKAARCGFLAEGALKDTALVSLELAAFYGERGRTEELRGISDEMLAIFSSGRIPRESLQALNAKHAAIIGKGSL